MLGSMYCPKKHDTRDFNREYLDQHIVHKVMTQESSMEDFLKENGIKHSFPK